MKVEKYKSDNIPEEKYVVVSNLLHDAFEERRQQNIGFKCGNFKPEEVKENLKGENYLFIAINDADIPVGTASLKIRKKYGYVYGFFESLGVASFYRRKGVASLLAKERIKLAIELKLDFLSSTTACRATSSVLYHKKMGFSIYMKSYGNDYNSYSFILPLKRFVFFKIEPFRYIIYVSFTSFFAIIRILRKIKI